jgi:hypothetical protein
VQQTDAGVLASQFKHHLGSSVGGIVIDKDGFPRDPLKSLMNPRDQRRNVIPLVESGQDDREQGVMSWRGVSRA